MAGGARRKGVTRREPLRRSQLGQGLLKNICTREREDVVTGAGCYLGAVFLEYIVFY